MEATRETTPVILSQFATNTIGVPNSMIFPSSGLVNPLAVPVEITEILLTQTSRTQGFNGGLFPTEISLRAGRHGLTNGRVPTLALGPMYTETFGEGGIGLLNGDRLFAYTSRWVLPCPIVLRAGEALAGEVALSQLANYAGLTGTVQTRITARGRRMPVGTNPKVSAYPFVSGGFIAAANAPIQDLAFQNILTVPLTVCSIVAVKGEINDSNNYSAIGTGVTGTGLGSMLIVGPAGAGGGSRHTVLDGSTAAFGARSAIEIDFILAPSEALRVQLAQPYNGNPAAITIVGRREEAA